MILPEKLKEIAKKSQTSFLNIARDYLQALFLYSFYQQKESSAFFFKGGTAFHFVYQSPRFSEDLDFSAKAFNCRVFEGLLTKSLLFLEENGLVVDLIESKPTSGGCLAIFSTLIERVPVRIQIEVSLREPKKTKGEAVLVKTSFLSAFGVLILKEEKLAAEKIKALLARKKSRDFYDLYFIFRSGLKVKLSGKERVAIGKEVDSLDRTQIASDLKEFLPRSHRLIIKDLPVALKRELERTCLPAGKDLI